MPFSKRKIFFIASIILIVCAALINIFKNKISVHPIPYGDDLIITIDESIPPGEYDLYYYVTASGQNNATRCLEFTLKSNDTLWTTRSYSSAVGFASSSFTKKESQDIAATFHHITNDSKISTYAGIGNVYIKSKDNSFEKAIFIPSQWGRQASNKFDFSQYPQDLNEKLPVSDFASLTNFSIDRSNLNLTFLCEKDINERYELGLKISTDSINKILPNGIRHSFYELTQSVEGWTKGEEYEQSINLNLPPGRYTVDLAILPDAPDTVGNIKSAQFADNKNKIPMGSIEIKGQMFYEFLNQIEENQLVIISIMDEGASSLDALSLQNLSALGLQADLSGKIRWSYLAVAAKGLEGFVPYENLSQEFIQAEFLQGSLFGSFPLPFNLKLESAGFEVGNKSSIIIDETEYSPRTRGMNVVIYDLSQNKVIESINFDTYERNFRYIQ